MASVEQWLENPISIASANSIIWKYFPWYGNILDILWKYYENKIFILWKRSSFSSEWVTPDYVTQISVHRLVIQISIAAPSSW